MHTTLVMSFLLLLLPVSLIGRAWDAPGLRAGDFESGRALESWELNVYGAAPKLTLDKSVRHGGDQALRIESTEPSDTALGQEITLAPGRSYRLSGWVRTKALIARSASVLGTLQIQGAKGNGIIASGSNHEGDTDWAEVQVFFRSPPDGRVRVCLFFAGFGTGAGVAWFDDIRLAEINPEQFTVRLRKPKPGADSISPLQYGQFIEYLCNLVPGMWAEKLYDGSFEGLSPYKFEFLRETDFREKPWYPSGEVNRAEYALDPTTRISGEVSKRIRAGPGAPCTVGLSQDGVFVERAKPCELKCWLRADGIGGPVRVRLHREATPYATCAFRPGTEWQKFSARLTPSGRDENATLSIEFSGPGTLWLDNASLMPADSIGGWRRDVVAAVRALKPGVIRFGGSALDDPNLGEFEWKDTVGDFDRRRPFRAWGGLQPVGPGLEEIVQFCRAVGAEPLICVRINGRGPREAAEEVEYFNGSDSTPMGAWRARNGHREPYHIRFWQVGNERSGPDYEQRLPSFCEAMKAVDANIQLMSSFPSPGVLRGSGQFLEFVCPHHYSQDLAWMENDLLATERMIAQNAPGRDIHIGVTEWNTTAGDAGPRRAMLWSLANALACSRYHNLLHRHSGSIKIANRSNLANSFCSGIVQTDNHRLFKTPTYYAQRLYATLAGTCPLPIDCALPANFDPDLSATISADGKTLTIFAVNDSPEDISRSMDLSEFCSGRQTARVWILADRQNAGEPDAVNSFAAPERIAPTQSRVFLKSPRFVYRFPRLSLTVLRMRTGSR